MFKKKETKPAPKAVKPVTRQVDEETPPLVPVEQKTEQSGLLCDCGEPVAKELGQNRVCAKHIRTT